MIGPDVRPESLTYGYGDEPRQGGVAFVARGSSRPGALFQELSSADDLNRLADTAHESFEHHPEDRLVLARQLDEFVKAARR
jgi:hypothetical protein